MSKTKIKIESTTPEIGDALPVGAVTPASSAKTRLCGMVDRAGLPLVALILTNEDSDHSGASAGPIGRRDVLVYCLLCHDWGSLARFAESNLDVKANLSVILGITDREWGELHADEPVADDPIEAARYFIEGLMEVCQRKRS